MLTNESQWPTYNDSELWKFKFLCESSIHPDTHEMIPRLFRTNHFTLVNLPIIMGLASLPQTGLIPYAAQILNQTYNAGMNYNNRNATVATATQEILAGYSLAIGTSLGLM